MDTQLKFADPDPKTVDLLTKGLNCHPLLAALLSIRGISTVEDASFFLQPDFKHLTDPLSLKDIDKATERIFTAVTNKEKILILGDFDADGVTSTALLSSFLEYCDANISWYIPHRIKEGHGFQPDHISMALDRDIDLIITVDNGVSSHEAVGMANDEDIDVIITDHHEPEETLPPALAVVDPKRADCPSGLSYLAGVGVAFFLIMALRKCFREKRLWEEKTEPNLLDYLDLFAIGTIGDMVPLTHENRIFCMAGLKRIREGNRPGLKSLAKISRIDVAKIDSDDISFKIVPRINAAGRISHARICVSQLMGTDYTATQRTASLLDELNTKRQQIELEIVTQIEHKIAETPSLIKEGILFLWDKKWNPSVLGIVASKLTRKYFCPVLLFSCSGEYAVGSGRSIKHINIHKALRENAELFKKFGGHAMAAGLTMEKKHLETLCQNLKHHIKAEYTQKDFLKTMTIDAILDFDDIDLELAREIDRLRPFGMANPEPVFLCEDIRVASSHIIGRNHRKMVLEKASGNSQHRIEALHFNISNPKDLPVYYRKIAFTLKINRFKKEVAQLIIESL